MKKVLLLIFGLMLTPLIVQAQETYSVNVPAGDVNTVNRERLIWNASVCARGGLAANCTQGQACAAPQINAPGGSGCSAAQARSVDAEIFASTQAGREGFFIRKLLVRLRAILRGGMQVSDSASQCLAWRVEALADVATTVRDAMCLAASTAPGSTVPASVALGCQLCSD